ncbi:hypothetical protein RB195_003402 [Necator americanus]|uniref:Secreted protein n=1 Tax=Necator americanus TaxID=51031 RepID=A0ABR1DNF1_NECAM
MWAGLLLTRFSSSRVVSSHRNVATIFEASANTLFGPRTSFGISSSGLMNQGTTAAVRTPAGCTTPFEVVTGVEQEQ